MREIKLCLAVATAVLTATVLAPAANAHQSPEGCIGSDPMVRFHQNTISQTEGNIRQGDEIVLGARIANMGTAPCDLSQIKIRVLLPAPDGGPGEYRVLSTGHSLMAGGVVEGFTEVPPYAVNLNEGVFEAQLGISWEATVHSGDDDSVISGEGPPVKFTLTRPRTALAVDTDHLSGQPPLSVTFTYSLTNTSPSSSDGTPGPGLIPDGGPEAPMPLSDPGCAGITYLSGDNSPGGTPTLDPGETWKFTCTRVFLQPGIYESRPTVTGTSSADFRPWPQPAAVVTPVSVLGTDLTIEKSHRGDLLAGRAGQYRLRVINNGNQPTSGAVTVADQLPAGLTASSISGEGWACDLGSVSCTRSDPLASGASYPDVLVHVTAAAKPPEVVVNTATVSGGGEPEAARLNNSASDPTTIRSPAQPTPPKGKVFRVRKVTPQPGGTAKIRVSVPAAGRLVIDDAGKPDFVTRVVKKTRRAGTLTVRVRASRKLRGLILKSGRPGKARVRISFHARGNPQTVTPVSAVRTINFRFG